MSNPTLLMNTAGSYRKDIYDAVETRLNRMIDKHCKVMNYRCNLQLPQDYQHDGGNKEISKVANLTMADLNKKGIDAEYVWVREQNKSENPHYHISLMMDGSKINSVWSVKNIIDKNYEKVIQAPTNGLQNVQNKDNDYQKTMIRRPAQNATGDQLEEQQQRFDYAKDQALKTGLYMAKTHTKGKAPPRVREFQGSQPKEKKKKDVSLEKKS